MESVPPHSVIVAVLEMSLLGDGFFTREPLHSSTSSASTPVFKRCRCKSLRAQTCDLSLASLSGSTTTSITHDCASNPGLNVSDSWAIMKGLRDWQCVCVWLCVCGEGVFGSCDCARNPSSLKRYPSSHSAVRAAVWKYVSVKQQREVCLHVVVTVCSALRCRFLVSALEKRQLLHMSTWRVSKNR